MPKRFARSVTGAPSTLSQLKLGRSRGAAAVAAAIEPLEGRTLLSATPPIVTVDWKGKSVQAYQGQYVLQTKNLKAFEALATSKGFTVQSLGGNDDYEIATSLSTATVAKLAAAHPDAMGAIAPNGVTTKASTFPNDPLDPLQYYLQNTGQTETFDYNQDGVITNGTDGPNENQVGIPGDDIDVKNAWDYTTGSPTVVVAVLDTGIDLTHPDLVNNIFTNPGEIAADNIDNDNNGYVDDVNGWNFVNNNNDTDDDNGHGTNVAGIIGAQGNNALGVTGVDWTIKLLPVKVLNASGIGSDAITIAGVNYVTALKDEGVNIVAMNESFTSSTAGFPFDVADSNAVKAAGNAGILDVVAAGDLGQNNDLVQSNPQQYGGAISTVISVAATDNQGKLATFSNYGAQTVDLAAPGINIESTALGGTYGALSGTSQAAPQVTGIIALEAAIKPNATPAQLKAALLDGVTPDAALGSVNGTAAKVRTGGVANAFNAVKNILDQYVSTDTVREGNWSGFYGAQGAYIVGDTSAFPSFAAVTLDGAATQIVKSSTNYPVALNKISDPADRIEAYDASTTTESINIDFTDGVAHRTRLYVADYDKQKRSELIQILDTASGQVLDSESVTDFKKGEYLAWDLRGSVTIKITNTGGPSAVFSGLFFDNPPANENVFKGTDTTTTGSQWSSKYGSQGQYIVGDSAASNLPSYAQLSVAGETGEVLKNRTNNAYALQKVDDYKHNIEAFFQSSTSFTVGLNLTDGAEHNVTLYTADYNNKKRAERISVIDVATGDTLYTEDLSSLGKGTFSTFEVSGDVQFVISTTGGGTAVLSGLFLDGPPGSLVQFDGVDNGSEGNWRAAGYGTGAAFIVGQNFAGVDNLADPRVTVSGETEFVNNPTSTDPRALQSTVTTAANQRIESYIYSPTNFTVNVDFADNLQHRMELYVADYENAKRSEIVSIYSDLTGNLLTTQRVSNFKNGRYLNYDFRGPVKIVFVNAAGPNAVLSGLFVD